MNRAGANSYYLYDGLGSTRQLTDSTGNVTVSYTYDSFGNLIDSTGTSDNTYGFTGEQQFEEADNLVFLRTRYYDPKIGRFISRDPMLSLDYYAVGEMDLQKFRGLQKIVKPRWLNPYVYCLNNPVNLVDPTGGCSKKVPVPSEIPEWIIEAGIVKGIGGDTGRECAETSCEKGWSSKEAFDRAWDTCSFVLRRRGIALGTPGDTTSIWAACAAECERFVLSDGYKKKCGCE
jgi:RHS repeat-associated protein